ncbi:ABC transporter substrate-binding protein [Ruania alba]|nr:ABC transporter substrate-binding protein [Ruania alba]
MKRHAVTLAVGTALVLSACGANANSNDGDADGAGTATDTLTVAYSEGGTTLDPAIASDVTSDTFVLAAYDQLVTYARTETDGQFEADTSEIEPMLAESWDVSEDDTRYTFHLREGATFHDGSDLTAEDVDATFDYIASSSNASFLYGMAGIDDVQAIDEYTVQIDLTAPNHLFLQILPMYSFSIINMDLVEENGGTDWLASNTAGSGPYTVDSWDPASEAVLSRNDDYWGEAPALRQVTMKFIGEASNRVQLLQNGEVDVALEVPPKDVESLDAVDGVTIDSRASNKILYFAMNNAIEPFDDPLVRQAISYAIPYENLISDVMMGQASPMHSSVASSTPGWTDAGYGYSHDLDRARELLEEAGYPDGFEFDFTLGSGFQDWADDAVLIQAELAEIGVTMNIENMARPQFLDALATGEVQSYISRWTSFVNDPGYHLGLLLTEDGTSNYVNYRNDEVNDLWEQAATEPDADIRADLYGQMQEIISTEAPWAYLYEYNIVVAHRDGVEGYTSYPDGIIRFFQMSRTA